MKKPDIPASSTAPPPGPRAAPGRGRFLPGRRLAAPSWVFPGGIADNCAFLADKVDEAGLLFFEVKTSLAYGHDDLPLWLADLPLRYHVHLPVDLALHRPFTHAPYREAQAARDARLCLHLLRKVDFLSGPAHGRTSAGPGRHPRAVLHPPAPAGPSPEKEHEAARRMEIFFRAFAGHGGDCSRLLLENVRGNDLLCLEAVMSAWKAKICLDVGHALAYGHDALVNHPPLLRKVGLLHVSAPGHQPGRCAHLPLTAADADQARAIRRMIAVSPASAVVMLELFDWEQVRLSLPILEQWLLP